MSIDYCPGPVYIFVCVTYIFIIIKSRDVFKEKPVVKGIVGIISVDTPF